MSDFDWHSDVITKSTVVDNNYRNTQNVRRYLTMEYGSEFTFNREFMAWIKNGQHKTMGDVASKWLSINEKK